MDALCNDCQHFNVQKLWKTPSVEEFKGQIVGRWISRPLEKIELQRRNCRFCELLYESIGTPGIEEAKRRNPDIKLYIHLKTDVGSALPLEITHLTTVVDVDARRSRILGFHGKIHLFASQDSPAYKNGDIVGLTRRFPTDSEDHLSWVASRLQTCVSNHSECRSSANLGEHIQDETQASLPTRLINVEYDPPRLEITDKQNGCYAALSYTWGPNQTYITRTTNIEQRMRGMNLSDMPRTHREAIQLCRYLKIKYLWIDALCILQLPKERGNVSEREKDLERQDKNTEMSRMGLYYGNAYLTIAACAGTDCDAGVFSAGQESERAPVELPYMSRGRFLQKGTREGSFFAREELPPFHETVMPAKFYKFHWWYRGWTVQERLLSRRIAYFSSSRVFFQCREKGQGTVAADGEIIDREEVSRGSNLIIRVPRNPILDWDRAVEIFTKCAISYQEDRAKAMLGISTKMCESRDMYADPVWDIGRFRWGLWTSLCCASLLWRVGSAKPRENTVPGPSWSWLSRTTGESSPIVWPSARLSNELLRQPADFVLDHFWIAVWTTLGASKLSEVNLICDIERMSPEPDSQSLFVKGYTREVYLCSNPTSEIITTLAKDMYPLCDEKLPQTYTLKEAAATTYCCDSEPGKNTGLECGWAVLDDARRPSCGRYICLASHAGRVRLKHPFSTATHGFGLFKSMGDWPEVGSARVVYCLILERIGDCDTFKRVGMGQLYRFDWAKKRVVAKTEKTSVELI